MVLIIFTKKHNSQGTNKKRCLQESFIKMLGININGATIEAHMQAKPQVIHSFIKCPKHHKNIAPPIKDWIVQKRKHNQAAKYEEIFYYLNLIVIIKPWNEKISRNSTENLQCYICKFLLNMSNKNKIPGKILQGLMI